MKLHIPSQDFLEVQHFEPIGSSFLDPKIEFVHDLSGYEELRRTGIHKRIHRGTPNLHVHKHHSLGLLGLLGLDRTKDSQ